MPRRLRANAIGNGEFSRRAADARHFPRECALLPSSPHRAPSFPFFPAGAHALLSRLYFFPPLGPTVCLTLARNAALERLGIASFDWRSCGFSPSCVLRRALCSAPWTARSPVAGSIRLGATSHGGANFIDSSNGNVRDGGESVNRNPSFFSLPVYVY